MNVNQPIREIEEEIIRMSRLEEEILSYGKPTTKDKLRCAIKGNSYQYYVGKKYIPKSEKKKLKEMANREYREKLLTVVRENIRKLERLKKCYTYDFSAPEAVYTNLHPARKHLVTPLILPKEEYIRRWQDEPYERWEIADEDVRGVFITERGERVRSKSEKIIADALYRNGVPYKYECPLKLRRGRQMVQVRPDFTALSLLTMEEMIIEHLGMMDDEQYFLKSMDKIDLYEKNGYLIGQKLLLLHETMEHPLDTTVMEKYITTYLTDISE